MVVVTVFVVVVAMDMDAHAAEVVTVGPATSSDVEEKLLASATNTTTAN